METNSVLTLALVPYDIEASVYAAKLNELKPGAKVALYYINNEFGKAYIDEFKKKGNNVIVVDKSGPGAGASGIACGCVRNLYMTEPIHAILRHSVDVWSSDPVALDRAGDSFAFASTQQHRCANPTEAPTKVLWVITPPHY